MPIEFVPLHPLFAAEARGVDLAALRDPQSLAAIRDAMDRFAVLVFRDQRLDDRSQVAFAERLDGRLHSKTGISALGANRFGNEALTDVSNVDENGELLPADDRRRHYRQGQVLQCSHRPAGYHRHTRPGGPSVGRCR